MVGDAKFSKVKNPASNGYEAGGGEVNRQVACGVLNQPKPPATLPRRNDDNKGSISTFENQFSTRAPHNFLFLTTFFFEKK
jgi:hypothetical protein